MKGKERWQDWIKLVLGAWLFVAPFFGLGAVTSAAAWNGYAVGAVIIVLSLVALFIGKAWEEWLSMVIGIWLIAAPVALGFFHHHDVMLNHVDVGAAIFLVSLWAALAQDMPKSVFRLHDKDHAHMA
jgi:general stress protein CsbA